VEAYLLKANANAQLILSHTGQASTQKTLKKPKIMLLQTHMTFYLDWNTKGNVLHEVDDNRPYISKNAQ